MKIPVPVVFIPPSGNYPYFMTLVKEFFGILLNSFMFKCTVKIKTYFHRKRLITNVQRVMVIIKMDDQTIVFNQSILNFLVAELDLI
jgi:hypothetical protein